LEHVHTGLYCNHWLVSIRYPDWETLAKATRALARDAEHEAIKGEMAKISHMDERIILVEHDV